MAESDVQDAIEMVESLAPNKQNRQPIYENNGAELLIDKELPVPNPKTVPPPVSDVPETSPVRRHRTNGEQSETKKTFQSDGGNLTTKQINENNQKSSITETDAKRSGGRDNMDSDAIEDDIQGDSDCKSPINNSLQNEATEPDRNEDPLRSGGVSKQTQNLGQDNRREERQSSAVSERPTPQPTREMWDSSTGRPCPLSRLPQLVRDGHGFRGCTLPDLSTCTASPPPALHLWGVHCRDTGQQQTEMLQTRSLKEGGQEVAAAEATGPEGAAGGTTNQNSRRDCQPTTARPSPHLGLKEGTDSVATPSAQGVPEAPDLDGTEQLDTPRQEISPAPTEIKRQVVTYEQLGIVTDEPNHPNMAMADKRAGTYYCNWPSNNACTPLDLSKAGFFYAGYSDCVRCFFCGGALKSWEPGDNPWVQHARWFPKCAYIKLYQGQDFIDIVQELNSEADTPQITVAQINEEVSKRRAAGDCIQEPAVDPAIVSVLQLGFSQDAVDSAVRDLQRGGHTVTADRLVDCLLRNLPEMNRDLRLDLDAEQAEMQEQIASLIAENNNIREQWKCRVCSHKDVCIAFLPCGHLSCCAECSPALRNCPVCRITVKGRFQTYPN